MLIYYGANQKDFNYMYYKSKTKRAQEHRTVPNRIGVKTSKHLDPEAHHTAVQVAGRADGTDEEPTQGAALSGDDVQLEAWKAAGRAEVEKDELQL